MIRLIKRIHFINFISKFIILFLIYNLAFQIEGNEWLSWNNPGVYNVTGWFTGVTALSKELIGNLSPPSFTSFARDSKWGCRL